MELNEQNILEFLRGSKHWREHMDDRKVDVFFSDGYGSPTDRTAFFCVQGSPNKFYGYLDHSGYAYSNLGKFKHPF